MSMIKLRKATYHKGKAPLLGPLDLDIASDQITCVMGHNGAGKSLLLGLCHGTLCPSQGHVTFSDTPVRHSRRSRGMIYQDTIVMRRSVAQNIAFPLQVAGMDKTTRTARTSEMLELTNLTDHADAPAAILSGGEAQRMALARALITRPKTVLMDEPTSNLDPRANTQFEQIISSIHAQGVGFIWATHDRAQAQRMASSIVFLHDGKLAEHSATDLFFQTPKTAQAARYLTGTV